MIIKKNANPGSKNSNKELTIRDIRLGSIVKLHLNNKDRGDHGTVNCEVIALFNSHGSEYFKVNGQDFAVANKGLIWTCSVSNIIELVEY